MAGRILKVYIEALTGFRWSQQYTALLRLYVEKLSHCGNGGQDVSLKDRGVGEGPMFAQVDFPVNQWSSLLDKLLQYIN